MYKIYRFLILYIKLLYMRVINVQNKRAFYFVHLAVIHAGY